MGAGGTSPFPAFETSRGEGVAAQATWPKLINTVIVGDLKNLVFVIVHGERYANDVNGKAGYTIYIEGQPVIKNKPIPFYEGGTEDYGALNPGEAPALLTGVEELRPVKHPHWLAFVNNIATNQVLPTSQAVAYSEDGCFACCIPVTTGAHNLELTDNVANYCLHPHAVDEILFSTPEGKYLRTSHADLMAEIDPDFVFQPGEANVNFNFTPIVGAFMDRLSVRYKPADFTGYFLEKEFSYSNFTELSV